MSCKKLILVESNGADLVLMLRWIDEFKYRYARVDRRPLDPPPIVQLRIFDVQHAGTAIEVETEVDYEYVLPWGSFDAKDQRFIEPSRPQALSAPLICFMFQIILHRSRFMAPKQEKLARMPTEPRFIPPLLYRRFPLQRLTRIILRVVLSQPTICIQWDLLNGKSWTSIVTYSLPLNRNYTAWEPILLPWISSKHSPSLGLPSFKLSS